LARRALRQRIGAILLPVRLDQRGACWFWQDPRTGGVREVQESITLSERRPGGQPVAVRITGLREVRPIGLHFTRELEIPPSSPRPRDGKERESRWGPEYVRKLRSVTGRV